MKDAVSILANNSGKLLVVPQNISVQDVVLENENLVRKLKVWKTKLADDNKVIDQAYLKIREAIKSEIKATCWPCHPADIHSEVQMPAQLCRFRVGVLSGCLSKTHPLNFA